MRFIQGIVFSFILLMGQPGLCLCQSANETWPTRVLITNDNGIDDPKIQALAQAFSKVAETWVIAPAEDKSGSSNYMSVLSRGALQLEKRDLGDGVNALSVDGFPADCILLGLAGVMNELPDLVISGINGGPNLGQDWFGSGTIGAARTASFAGVPAIAVSGLDDGDLEAVQSATRWIVRLARSPLVRKLKPPRFLTVSIPRIPPDEIRGIRVGKRAALQRVPTFELDESESATADGQLWRISGMRELDYSPPEDSDVALYANRYVVVVPMIATEQDESVPDDFWDLLENLPAWK